MPGSSGPSESADQVSKAAAWKPPMHTTWGGECDEFATNSLTPPAPASLFGVLNHCKTGAGSRMLRAALLQPSTSALHSPHVGVACAFGAGARWSPPN